MGLEASSPRRLRYWLHLFQAPRYGTGFIASERFFEDHLPPPRKQSPAVYEERRERAFG